MGLLSEADKTRFYEQGFLLVENAVSPQLLHKLQSRFLSWVEESKAYDQAYGETIDGRARFDLEPGHPQMPNTASFFDQQAATTGAGK